MLCFSRCQAPRPGRFCSKKATRGYAIPNRAITTRVRSSTRYQASERSESALLAELTDKLVEFAAVMKKTDDVRAADLRNLAAEVRDGNIQTNTSLTKVKEAVTTNTEDLTKVMEVVTMIKEDLTKVKEDVTTITEDLTTIKEDMRDIKASVAVLKEDLVGFKATVNAQVSGALTNIYWSYMTPWFALMSAAVAFWAYAAIMYSV